jgi:hypothetical protein
MFRHNDITACPHLHQVWVADGAADNSLHDGHVGRAVDPGGLLRAQQRVGRQLHHLHRDALAVPAANSGSGALVQEF